MVDENNNIENEKISETEHDEMQTQLFDDITIYPVESPITPPPAEVIKPKKQKNGLWMTISIVCIVLCLTSISFSVYLAAQGNTSAFKFPALYTPEYIAGQQLSASDKLDTPSVIKKVKPSVVNIIVQFNNYVSREGSGSGVIFTADGLIITNAHVIEGASSVKVKTLDGKEYVAEVIGYDTITDLAVIKVDAKNLPAAEFGDSSKIVEGEQVIAIGNPYGIELSHTSTQGIISAIRNQFRFENLNLVLDLFQHDAAINPGNSGGPLVNMYGQVIGINSLKIIGEYENIGFAIQLQSALPIIENLINNGKVDRPVIGITGSTEPTVGGIKVAEVSPGGAAEQAGLKTDDIIMKIDGNRVKSIEELINYLGKQKAGDEVEISVLRDAEMMDFKLILQSPPKK